MTRRYANPPVVEALCEVYTKGSAWDPTIPGLFYDRFRDRFPKRGQAQSVMIEATVGAPELAARVTSPEPRSQFKQEDGSRMIQVARDLIVVNQLRPYPAFEEWRPLILEALGIYQELARPAQVERIGLRYINRVVIPESEFPMDRYFGIYPQLPEALGSTYGSFMLRIEVPIPSPGHSLLATFGTAPADKGGAAFVLDLYDTIAEPDFNAVGRRVDEAHSHIERAFEAMITDATRRLFGEGPNAG